jgi:translation initiation factor 2B subunit (eIF-2B alpha/beta/delta family)
VGESLKLDRLGGEPPELEEMPAAELGVEPRPGLRVRNTYFDVTAPVWVHAYHTEAGSFGHVRDLRAAKGFA